MNRSVMSIFLAFSILLLSVSSALAVPLLQESNGTSESTDIIHAVSVFSQIFSAGMEAAASQLYGGEMYGTDAVTEEPASEPVVIPTSIPTEMPTAIPTAVPTEIPTEIPADAPAPLPPFTPESMNTEPAYTEPEPVYEPEAQVFAPPSDPEQYAVSFGIPVDDFYNNVRTAVKDSGRHSVSFEEKGRKSASKAVIDEDISIFLYYSKEKGENLINRINFEAKIADEKQQQNVEGIFITLLETLCKKYYDIAYDESTGSDLFALAMNNGSAYLGDLLLYGNVEPKDGGTELVVKIYYAGDDF